jgi:hypothetical protein
VLDAFFSVSANLKSFTAFLNATEIGNRFSVSDYDVTAPAPPETETLFSEEPSLVLLESN